MSTYLGNISVFDYKTQAWDIFFSRINIFFKVNNIKENRSNILLTYLSDDTYVLLRNLIHPKNVEDLNFDELTTTLTAHFTPKRSTFADRAIFYSAVKIADETMEEWLVRLRGLAVHCEFGLALETVLRDRFILGLPDGPERNKLFEQDEKILTVAKALELAQQTRCVKMARSATLSSEVSTLSPNGQHIKEETMFRMDGGDGQKVDRAIKGLYQCGKGGGKVCEVCGMKSHSTEYCRYKNYKCQLCGTKGHLKKVCKRRKAQLNQISEAEAANNESGSECDECKLFNMRYVQYEPHTITVLVNNQLLNMEIDSGAGMTVISEKLWRQFFSMCKLTTCDKSFCYYTGHKIKPIGTFTATVEFNNNKKNLLIFVIRDGGPPLLGRDFMAMFDVGFTNLNNISNNYDKDVETLLKRYADLWKDELGKCSKFTVSLRIKPGSKPKFFKPRPVPFALKGKVEAELDRLVQLGVLVPTTYSEYGTPIVPVLKADGSIRICGDYSQTINKDLEVERYPLPRIEEVFAKLQNGEHYSKIDLKMAYNQLLLSTNDGSQELTTISTSKGLYKYTRLVFGLANAPAIFQRVMETLLMGIEGVVVWIDDICITAPNKFLHLQRLETVLQRLQAAGLRLQKEKCNFFSDSVTYLGFVIDKTGLRTCPKKVQAINEAPVPTNVRELKRFLGMVNYYRKFIPDASSILSPLHELLRDDSTWRWGDRQQRAYNQIKRDLMSERVLAHFDPEARLVLSVDAGPDGLGAVLSQGPDGQERPLAYASRSLSVSERNYSQIQKEATAIVFGVKYFHQYLYGRSEPFILKTDHKPLLAIFGKGKGISVMAASRLQRYAIYLSAYNYVIQYTSSDKNVTADYFSRAPIPLGHINDDIDDDYASLNFLDDTTMPISYDQIKATTGSDRTLKTVIKYMQKGWPRKVKCKSISPYFNCKTDLETQDGCLLRGHRIVIPGTLRDMLLTELHKGHLGIVKTKGLARSRMWWPGIDADIERTVSACPTCSALRPAPPRAPPSPWPRAPGPWWRIHIDYMSVGQKMYLVVVDSFSKWLECLPMNGDTSTRSLITKLKYIFSRLGLPKMIVSDNDAKIKTSEFDRFCKMNGIEHVTSPIYHPASNGQAENSVRTCKKMLKCILSNSGNKFNNEDLLKYLFEYRNSIHCSTGLSPAKLIYGRDLRCRLDLVCPRKEYNNKSENTIMQKENTNVIRNKCLRSFKIGDEVWLRWYIARKPVWRKGIICKIIGNRLYSVSVTNSNGSEEHVVRHINQIIKYTKSNVRMPFADAISSSHSQSTPATGRSITGILPKAPTNSCSLCPSKRVTVVNDVVDQPISSPVSVSLHDNLAAEASQAIDDEEQFVDARDGTDVAVAATDSERLVEVAEPCDQGIAASGDHEESEQANSSLIEIDRYNLRPRKSVCYKE